MYRCFICLLLCLWGAQPAQAERLPDFNQYNNTTEKKIAFFNFLRPIVVAENHVIQLQRKRLLALNVNQLNKKDTAWLLSVQQLYKLPTYQASEQAMVALLKRVDTVPVELALTQAAIESGWGSSRFARLANNLYGEWCYTPGCGIVPLRRPVGAKHEVKRFKSISASVQSYLRNLNTHKSYAALRKRRYALRLAQKPVTAEALAQTLQHYSERGDAYVQDVLRFLIANKKLMLKPVL